MTEEMNSIKDESNDHSYFTIVPNLVKFKCRNPYDLALWIAVKERAGENGECFLGTRKLAAWALMSKSKAIECRSYLLKVGLLEGEKRLRSGGDFPVWHLRIPDVWQENIEKMGKGRFLINQDAFREKLRSESPQDAMIRTDGSSHDLGRTNDLVGRTTVTNKNPEKEKEKSVEATPSLDEWFSCPKEFRPLSPLPLDLSSAKVEDSPELDEAMQIAKDRRTVAIAESAAVVVGLTSAEVKLAGLRARQGADFIEIGLKTAAKREDIWTKDQSLGARLLRVWIEKKGLSLVVVPDKTLERWAVEFTAISSASGLDINDDQAVEVLSTMLDPKGEYAWHLKNSWRDPLSSSFKKEFVNVGIALLSGGSKKDVVVSDGPESTQHVTV